MGRIRLARMWLALHMTRVLLGKPRVGIIHDALFLYAEQESNQHLADEADMLCLYSFPANEYTRF